MHTRPKARDVSPFSRAIICARSARREWCRPAIGRGHQATKASATGVPSWATMICLLQQRYHIYGVAASRWGQADSVPMVARRRPPCAACDGDGDGDGDARARTYMKLMRGRGRGRGCRTRSRLYLYVLGSFLQLTRLYDRLTGGAIFIFALLPAGLPVLNLIALHCIPCTLQVVWTTK